MSVFEPHPDPRSEGAGHLPTLDVVLRGRKGEQVAAYIKELADRLDQQRVRAEQAEQAAAHLQSELDELRNQPPPSFEHLGVEAAKVLEAAGHSAEVLVDKATDRGRSIVEQAKAHAAELVQAAERDAQTRLDAARQAAEQMLAKAGAERSAVEAQTKRLREYRDGLLGHLGRVEADLASFLSEVGSPPPARAEAATEVQAEPVKAEPAETPETPEAAGAAAETPAAQEAAEEATVEAAPVQEADAAADSAPTVEIKRPAGSAIGTARAPK
jgi:polyhydroxyalkanoate synthesis regulator phasin